MVDIYLLTTLVAGVLALVFGVLFSKQNARVKLLEKNLKQKAESVQTLELQLETTKSSLERKIQDQEQKFEGHVVDSSLDLSMQLEAITKGLQEARGSLAGIGLLNAQLAERAQHITTAATQAGQKMVAAKEVARLVAAQMGRTQTPDTLSPVVEQALQAVDAVGVRCRVIREGMNQGEAAATEISNALEKIEKALFEIQAKQ